MADFMLQGALGSVEIELHSGIGRVELDGDAVIDNAKCCDYFDQLGVMCDRIEVYHGHHLMIEFRKNPVLGWLADHKGQC